ncbi:MAG: DUF488 family protein [Paracoccaceae bacterium]
MSDLRSSETGPAGRLRIKRVYLPAEASDGRRILVDRLWPRGLTKDRAALSAWCRDIAPSDGLRRWFHAHADQWAEFVARYETELSAKGDLVGEIAGYAQDGPVTLLYAAKDEARNNAVALRDHLRRCLGQGGAGHDAK